MRVIILFLIFVFALNAMAEEQQSSRFEYMAFAGVESRMEENIQNELVVHNLNNISLGIAFDDYRILFERAVYSETTGNATLNVKRDLEDYMLWGQYRMLVSQSFDSFAGAGVGAYRNVVETTLGSAVTKNSADYKLLTGLGFGVGAKYKFLYSSLEVRLLFGDELDRQPTIGSLLKFGFIF